MSNRAKEMAYRREGTMQTKKMHLLVCRKMSWSSMGAFVAYDAYNMEDQGGRASGYIIGQSIHEIGIPCSLLQSYTARIAQEHTAGLLQQYTMMLWFG